MKMTWQITDKKYILFGYKTHHGSLAYSSILFFRCSLWRNAYRQPDVTAQRDILKGHFMCF